MVFGRFLSFAVGGVMGAYGMHQYILSQAQKGKFPDWSKISKDAKFAINKTTETIQRAINDEETQKTIQKAKEKGAEVYEKIKEEAEEASKTIQADDRYKNLKKNAEEKYEEYKEKAVDTYNDVKEKVTDKASELKKKVEDSYEDV